MKYYWDMAKEEKREYEIQFVKKIKEDEKYYTIIAHFEGNFDNNSLISDRQQIAKMEKQQISISLLKEKIEKIEKHFNKKIKKVEVMMSIFDYSKFDESEVGSYIAGDPTSIRLIKDKKATYNVAQNKLMIWEDGYPVYENCNGIVTKDRDALADCYL